MNKYFQTENFYGKEVKMKQQTVMAFAFSLLVSAVFNVAGGEVVQNGKFTETGAPPKNAKGIIGTQWVKSWNCAGAAELKEGAIHLSAGVIYQFLYLPADGKPYVLKGEIKASSMPGKNGVLDARMSTCVRKNPNMPFQHAIQRKFGPFKLADAVRGYQFELKIEPYEQGYFYVGGSNVKIESVSVAAEPAAEK